jgi:hypothetical protein
LRALFDECISLLLRKSTSILKKQEVQAFYRKNKG